MCYHARRSAWAVFVWGWSRTRVFATWFLSRSTLNGVNGSARCSFFDLAAAICVLATAKKSTASWLNYYTKRNQVYASKLVTARALPELKEATGIYPKWRSGGGGGGAHHLGIKQVLWSYLAFLLWMNTDLTEAGRREAAGLGLRPRMTARLFYCPTGHFSLKLIDWHVGRTGQQINGPTWNWAIMGSYVDMTLVDQALSRKTWIIKGLLDHNFFKIQNLIYLQMFFYSYYPTTSIFPPF